MNSFKSIHYLGYVFFCLMLFSGCSTDGQNDDQNGGGSDENDYFTNPIKYVGADPWMVKNDDSYYLSEADGNDKIYVSKSSTITGIKTSPTKNVWTGSSGIAGSPFNNFWGATLSYLQGEWYIYFAGHTQIDDTFMHQRMWVLKADTSDPMGAYTFIGEVLDSSDTRWGIDGNVLERSDGSLYFVWSGVTDFNTQHQSTFIARMLSPVKIDISTITEISYPTEIWETSVRPIQEGQRPLYVDKNGKTIIMYSANASWTDEYCLGSFSNTDGDFLNPASWIKSSSALFSKTSQVFGPGGASYVKSPDGTEDWIVYHAARSLGSGWKRDIRTQKFTWDSEMNPVFGDPEPVGKRLARPSGE